MANPFPFTAGQVLTAAQLNGIGEAWTTFTPVWTASGTAPAIGNGTLTGKYVRVNKLVIASIVLLAGSTTTYGTGYYLFNFPVAAKIPIAPYAIMLSEGLIYDASGFAGYKLDANYNGNSTTEFRVNYFSNASQNYALAGATQPVTLATGDEFYLNLCYEAA